MSCSKCGSSTSCGCSGTAYYLDAEVCIEDHCQKTYEQQFTFAICVKNSWNVPSCGQAAVLSVPGLLGASIGSYLWHTSYGYFQITSVDANKGQIGVVNNCTAGNASPGTQIPKCTCFVVTDAPLQTAQSSTLFPYLALDFTAPASGDCTDITVTTVNGISIGDTISIGSGYYEVDSFTSTNVIRICNTGDGIVGGSPVVAKDLDGNYIYPIYVTESCCVAITAGLAALAADLDSTTISYTAFIAGALAVGITQTAGGGVAFSYNNSSTTRTANILVTYVLTLDYEMAGGTRTDTSILIETNSNGAGWVSIMPIPSYGTTFEQSPRTVASFTVPVVYTVAPSTVLSVSARSSVENNGVDNIVSLGQYLNVKGIVCRVD